MVKKETLPPEPPKLAIARVEAERKINERIEKGREIRTKVVERPAVLAVCKADFEKWSKYNSEMLRRLFTSSRIAEEYDQWFLIGGMNPNEPSQHEEVAELCEWLDDKINRLESIRERLELYPEAGSGVVVSSSHPDVARTRENRRKVFLVHGHDDAARESLARFVTKLRLEPIILHERPSGGKTTVEKLEHHSDVGFAVILLTPDDLGASKQTPTELQPRARQNVVLELGYFVGRLSRARVCALYKDKLELPSDYLGVVYVPMDEAGGWRLMLARELKEAGFSIDLNDAL